MIATSNKPKILIISPSAFIYGGLATWLDDLESAGEAIGGRIVVGLVAGPRHHRPRRYIAEHPHRYWEPIVCRTGTPQGRCRAICQAIRRIDPDLVLSVNIVDVYAAVGRLRQQGRFRGHCMMALHGMDFNYFQQLREVRSVVDSVAAVNQLACCLCTQIAGVDPDRVHRSICGVKMNITSTERSRDKSTLRIAYVNRMEQNQKRVLDLPRIAEHLNRSGVISEWLIAGSGPDEAELRAALMKCSVKAVHWLGKLNRQQVIDQVYRQADALLLTSLWETGPLVIREAMAHGLAVVTSRYIGSGLEATLKDDDNVLMFDIGDTRIAARQLTRLANEPDLSSRLTNRAHRMVDQCYRMDISICQWRQAFENTLARAPLPAPPRSTRATTTGRLDRLLGCSLGETVRTLLGQTGPDAGAGGEWPHVNPGLPKQDQGYWQMVAREDAVPFVESTESPKC